MWTCTIEGCGRTSESVDDLLVHQASEHDRTQCDVCGVVVPDGYFAIRHALREHSRAEYVRAYDADADDIREREEVIDAVETTTDVDGVVSRIEGDPREQE